MTFPVYLANTATLQLDEDKCTGCGTCLEVCPHAVLARENGRVRIDCLDACMECGACAMNCPVQAITVQAGVGCANAVINTALGRNSASCCCVIDPPGQKAGAACGSTGKGGAGCC